MISTDGNHYPERLGTLVVINAPAMLSWTWKVIQGFLDDVQKAKIGIYGTDPNEWRPVLFKIIDKDQVPVSYGGIIHQVTQFIISNYSLTTMKAVVVCMSCSSIIFITKIMI
jgi:large-conductance mechanosensitive channel